MTIDNIRHGRVELQNPEGTEWIGMDIDDTGNFGMALDNGSVWIIREYWYETEDPTKDDNDPTKWSHNSVRLDREITVGTNSDDITLAPNFKIDLSASSDLIPAPEESNNFYSANLRPVLTQSDFINKYPNDANFANSEYQRYLLNPFEFWEFNIWVEGKYDSGNVVFYTYLDTGVYELMNVNGHNLS